MNRNIRIVTGLFLFTALSTMADESPPQREQDPFSKENSVTDPAAREYFPKGYDNWFRPHLRAMGEPSIFAGEGTEILTQFRFLYLPTFSKPISFRGYQVGDLFYVRVVRLTGRGGYEPGEVELKVDVQITKQEWDALQNAIVRSFDEIKLTDIQRNLISGFDGSQWILEARVGGKYHYEEVWEAEYWTSKDGIAALKVLEDDGVDVPILFSFVAACKEFLSLTDFALPSRMVPTEFKKANKAEMATPRKPSD